MPSEIVYHPGRGSASLGCRATYHPLITLRVQTGGANNLGRNRQWRLRWCTGCTFGGDTACTFAINHPTNRNFKISKALLKNYAHQGNSLFTSAATNQMGVFPKRGSRGGVPESLDLDRCLSILFWLSACE